MRVRSYSYSPSPPRGYSRRGHSPSPRDRNGSPGRDYPTSLLVRNLRRDCRPDDLRRPFGKFGPLKDVYLPRDYHTGEPRGFGFVQYVDPADAAEAKYQMDGQVLLGREVTVVFAEENRKKPSEMRTREKRDQRHDYRRSASRSPGYERSSYRSRSRSPRHSKSVRCSGSRYSRSPVRSPPPHSERLPRSPGYYSPSPDRHNSRPVSPEPRKHHRERSYSPSP